MKSRMCRLSTQVVMALAIASTASSSAYCWYAIRKAAARGEIEKVRRMLAADPSLLNKKHDGDTPLYCATYTPDPEVAEFLIAQGAVIDGKCSLDFTPLIHAAWEGCGLPAATLLKGGAKIYATEYEEQSVPDYTVRWDNKELSGRLLWKEAQVKAKDRYQMTPLHLAALANSNDVVQVLLEKGADVDTVDKFSRTPLHWAADAGYVDIVESLLARNASVNLKDCKGMSPLHYAVYWGHEEMVRLLFTEGAAINEKTGERAIPWGDYPIKRFPGGDTALVFAARCGYKAVTELLLANGAEVNAAGKEGNTPLHWAAFCGHGEVVKLLLGHGAKADVTNDKGETPAQWAIRTGHQDLAQLIEAGKVKTGAPKGEDSLLRSEQ